MNPRSGTIFRTFGSFVLIAVAGCGGLASSRETSDPPPSDELSNEVAEHIPEEVTVEMPPLFDVLELRQLSDRAVPDGSLLGCDYATRIKVNRVTGHLITGACEVDANGRSATAGGSDLLTSAQLAGVEDAYRQVRTSRAHKCSRGASILTLAIEVDRDTSRERLLFADDDHAGCPLPGVTAMSFVSGLFELSAKLEQLQER